MRQARGYFARSFARGRPRWLSARSSIWRWMPCQRSASNWGSPHLPGDVQLGPVEDHAGVARAGPVALLQQPRALAPQPADLPLGPPPVALDAQDDGVAAEF